MQTWCLWKESLFVYDPSTNHSCPLTQCFWLFILLHQRTASSDNCSVQLRTEDFWPGCCIWCVVSESYRVVSKTTITSRFLITRQKVMSWDISQKTTNVNVIVALETKRRNHQDSYWMCSQNTQQLLRCVSLQQCRGLTDRQTDISRPILQEERQALKPWWPKHVITSSHDTFWESHPPWNDLFHNDPFDPVTFGKSRRLNCFIPIQVSQALSWT